MPVLAPIPVIDPVAVADVEALLAAIPPDRELHELGKYLRKGAIELPGVDFAGDRANDTRMEVRSVTLADTFRCENAFFCASMDAGS
jgi:hypothetical protein